MQAYNQRDDRKYQMYTMKARKLQQLRHTVIDIEATGTAIDMDRELATAQQTQRARTKKLLKQQRRKKGETDAERRALRDMARAAAEQRKSAVMHEQYAQQNQQLLDGPRAGRAPPRPDMTSEHLARVREMAVGEQLREQLRAPGGRGMADEALVSNAIGELLKADITSE